MYTSKNINIHTFNSEISQGNFDASDDDTFVSAIDGYVFINIGTVDGGSQSPNTYAEINGIKCLTATWSGPSCFGTGIYPINTGDSIHVVLEGIRTSGYRTSGVSYNVTFFTIN